MSEHHKLLKRQDQLSARRKMLSAEQRALLERRLRGGTAGAGAPGPLPPIEPVPRGGELPLSYFQEYDLKRLAAGRESSAISKCFHVKGPFDREAFEQCLNALAARHEILRTTFPAVGGRHVQTIAPALDVKLPFATVAHLPAHERLPEALGLVSQCAFRPYDFAREPLWRSMLVGLGPNDHVLLLTTDHFISDAWSMDIFVRDAWVLYASFVTGARPNLAELPVQYADFSYWQRNVLSGPVLEGMTSYWLRKLDGMGLTPEVHFPNEVPLPPGATSDDSEVARFDIEIPEALTNSLRGLSQRKNTTMFIVTLSAFVALLHRYTGREDLGVCSPTANRNSPATKEVIGWFANTLVLRFNLSGVKTFEELLEQVRTVVLEAYEHQDVPYGTIYHTTAAAEVTPAPCIRFNMQAEMGLQSASQPEPPARPSPPAAPPPSRLEVTPIGFPRPSPATRRPGIGIDIGAFKGGLNAVAFYEVRRYPVALIEEILKNYRSILGEAAAEPGRRLSEFAFVVGSG